MLSFARATCLSIVVLALGCAAESSEPAAIEQAGTAGQDVEVAKLRSLFGRAKSLPTFGVLRPGSRSASGMVRTWQCERRDARRDAPSGAKPVTYAFTGSDDAGFFKNSADSFGRDFLPDSAGKELIGYDAPSGAIGEFVNVRAIDPGNRLIFEQFKRPNVANLSPADQAAWDALGHDYDTAVSGGLATAYTICGDSDRSAGGRPVSFFDDFKDPVFSWHYWSASASSSGAVPPFAFTEKGFVLAANVSYIARPPIFTEVSFYTTRVMDAYLYLSYDDQMQFTAQGVRRGQYTHALRVPAGEGKHYVSIVRSGTTLTVKVNEEKTVIAVAITDRPWEFFQLSGAATTISDVRMQ